MAIPVYVPDWQIGDGDNWAPVPGAKQAFRSVSEYPAVGPETEDWCSPHKSMTGAVLHLDVSEEAVSAAVGRESVSSNKEPA